MFSNPPVPPISALLAALLSTTLVACDLGKLTVNSTAQVMLRAQPSLDQESDYELARQAIPGALKTIEGFWIVSPKNDTLIELLTEGYCQYGTGFVEDDWEAALLDKNLAATEYHNQRSTNMFTRCLNYALRDLGSRWQKELFASPETVAKLVKETDSDKRNAMMWAGMALGSIINHNLTRMEMIAHVPTIEVIMQRVIEIDKKRPPAPQYAAMPYIALGMLHTAVGKALGGDPARAKSEFEMALQLTAAKDGTDRFLLARTLMAYRVGLMTNDRRFFHDQLKQVLMTAPSVWPEQRLANEVAHRKARRYLSKEKELF